MNKKITKMIALALILVSLISLGFIYINTKNSKKTPIQSEIFNQKLDLPNYFEGQTLDIKNNIKQTDFNFPTSLPYLQQTSTSILSQQAVNKISQSLGFTADPIKSNDIEKGEVLIWNGERMSLIIYPKTRFVQYTPGVSMESLVNSAVNTSLSESDYKNIAERFLTEKLELSATDISISDIIYFKLSGGVEKNLTKSTKDDYGVTQLNYSQNINNLPVYTNDAYQSQISTQILKDGSVVNANIYLHPTFDKSLSEYPLKNYQEFIEGLPESILVSLNDNNENLPEIKLSELKNTTVNSIKLMYLLEPNLNTILQPVFLISGTTYLQTESKNVNAVFYLPAFKDTNITEP